MTDKMVEAYLKALGNEERAAATIEKNIAVLYKALQPF